MSDPHRNNHKLRIKVRREQGPMCTIGKQPSQNDKSQPREYQRMGDSWLWRHESFPSYRRPLWWRPTGTHAINSTPARRSTIVVITHMFPPHWQSTKKRTRRTRHPGTRFALTIICCEAVQCGVRSHIHENWLLCKIPWTNSTTRIQVQKNSTMDG